MKRLAAILLPALLLACAAAQAGPGFVVVGRNGQRVVRFGLGNGNPQTIITEDDDTGADHPAAAPGASGKLRWQNGETLPGEPAGASSSALLWRTPLFEEQLQLRWNALRRYDRPGDAQPVADPFAFVLRDGSHLYGTPVAITADAVAIHSTRHGDVRLKRSEVLSARRVSRDGLPAGGSSGDAGWRALSISDGSSNGARLEFAPPSALAAAPLVTGPGGTLDLPYWNTASFKEMPLPDRVEVEFRVHAPKRPDFSLVLEPAPGEFLRVATWDDEVVLASGDRFVRLGRLADADREVAFRVFWDRPAGRCLVCTPEGVKVADWRTKPGDGETPSASGAFPAAFPPGVALLNKGRALTLDLLRVCAWDGAPPRARRSGQTRRLAGGRTPRPGRDRQRLGGRGPAACRRSGRHHPFPAGRGGRHRVHAGRHECAV